MRLTLNHYLYVVLLIGTIMILIMVTDTFLFPLGNISRWSVDLLSGLLSIVLILYIKQYGKLGRKIGAGEIAEYGLNKKEILILIAFLEFFGISLLLMVMHISGLI